MGINSENNNENLKQQEAMANAIDGATAGAQQFANATEAAGKAGKKMTGSLSEITEGIDDFSEGLDKALKSIHLLPGAIEEYTKVANKNMAYAAEKYQESFVKGLFNEKLWAVRAELGRETEELKLAMEAAKKSMEQAEASNDEYEKHTAQLRYEQLKTAYDERKDMKVSSQLNKKLAYDMKTELLKIGKQMFSDLWNYAKKILDEAYAKDKSTIEQNYGTIMSYNSYNHGEYAKLIDRLQKKIDASGLGDVISINTLQENLTKTMQSGLQGALAESNAYYASIAEKAGITFDWYGSEWTTLISQMNRTGKDYEKVMKSVISTTDDLAEIYGDSKGLSEGRANQMMAAASSLGTTYGLSEDAIGNIYKSLAVTSQELTNYGIDTNNFVQDITGALQSGLSNHDLGVIFGTGGATGDQVEQKIKEGKFDELILQYMNNLEDMYKGQNTEMVNALQGALGSSFSTTDYQAFQTYWEQEGSFSTNFEKAMGKSNSSIEDIEGELKNYVTTQESYETKMENSMADIAEWMVQNPVAEVLGKTIQSGLNTIIGILLGYLGNQALNKFLGSGSGGSGGSFSLKNLFSKSTSSGNMGKYSSMANLNRAYNTLQNPIGSKVTGLSSTEAAGKLLKDNVSFANVAKTAGFKNAVKGSYFNNVTAVKDLAKTGNMSKAAAAKQLGVGGTGGMLAGGAMIAAGAAMAVHDSITAGKSAAKNWDSYDDREKNIAIANVAKSFITGHDSNRTNDEKLAAVREKGGLGGIDWGSAAKNAGKGALIGGGIGAVAGGGVMSWATTGVGAAIGAAAGFVTNLADQAIDLHNFNKYAKSEYGKLSETMSKALEGVSNQSKAYAEYNTMLSQHADLEAQLQDMKSKGSDANARNIAQIELEIKKLERKIQLKRDELGDSDEIDKNLQNTIETMKESQNMSKAIENIDTTVSKKGWDKDTDWSKISDKDLEKIISNDQLKAFKAAGMKSTGDNRKDRIGLIQMTLSNGKNDINFVGEDYDQDIKGGNVNWSMMYGGKDSTFYKDQIDQVSKLEGEISSTVTTLRQNLGTLSDSNSFKEIQEQVKSYVIAEKADLATLGLTSDKDLADLAKSLNLDTLLSGLSEDYRKKYSDWLTNNSKASGEDKHFNGLFATGTDYVPYDNYLALLHRGEQVRTSAEVALEEANKHVASTETSRAIHDVVLNQTNTIISILTNIYDVLSSGSRVPATKTGSIKYDLPAV